MDKIVESKEVTKLEPTSNLKDVISKVNELVEAANKKRDRGPVSTKEMTEADARAVCLGEFKNLKHGDAAEKLGLSYGQVYSARKGFTFKPIYSEMIKAKI